MGLEIPLYTPIFVMSRIAGWAAHVIEQLENNRLIRPRACTPAMRCGTSRQSPSGVKRGNAMSKQDDTDELACDGRWN